jgi:hypothetical protein
LKFIFSFLDGNGLLHYLIKNGLRIDEGCLDLLFEKKYDFFIKDGLQNTPLAYALAKGVNLNQEFLVWIFSKKELEPQLISSLKESYYSKSELDSPLQLSRKQLFIPHYPIKQTEMDNRFYHKTPLLHLVLIQKPTYLLDKVQNLFRLHPDLSLVASESNTLPIHLAVQSCLPQIILAICSSPQGKSTLTRSTSVGNNVLHLLANFDHKALCTLMTQMDFTSELVLQKNIYGDSPLLLLYNPYNE